MLDLIEKMLTSDVGSFGFVFGLIVVIFWLAIWVTKKVTLINYSHSELVKNHEKLETKIDKNIDIIRQDLSYLKGKIEIIQKQKPFIAKSKSPMTLTDIGEQFAKELKADQMIERNWSKIYANIKNDVKNKNAYDIQQYCMDTAAGAIEKFLSEDDIISLKNFAFKNGDPILYYSPIFALIIRDKYFQTENINISDVDSAAPNLFNENNK